MKSIFSVLAPVLCMVLAAEQQSAHFAAFNDWLGGESKGIRIAADGSLKLAPNLRSLAQLSEGVIWAAIPDGSGGAYLSAGIEGKLYRYSGGQIKLLGQVKGGIVFAMARMGQDLIVAPSGEGKLLRVNPSGEVKAFADIEARLVWAMSVQANEVVAAGTGEKGAVLILAREGSSRKLAEFQEETAFTALAPDGAGGWFLGSHGKGLVLKLQNDRLETWLDTPFDEVRSLSFHDGSLYIGANNGLSDKFSSGRLERRETYLSADGSSSVKSAVYRLDKNRVPETLWQSQNSQVYALQVWKDQLLVGTGNRSRIFMIPLSPQERSQEPFAALQELGTGQASGFLPLGSDLLVLGSNPAELHALSESQATEGTLESRILKGNPLADWGRSYLDASTPSGTRAEIQFRVGNTETPDTTWTPWTPPLQSGERSNLPTARFGQLRVRLASSRGGATPIVDNIRTYWSNRNLAPVWENVEVMPPGIVITRQNPPDDIGIERIPLDVQKLIPALGYMGSERRSFRRGSQAFVFKITDPNNDNLQYRIRLLPDTGSPIPLSQNWKEKFFTFDTIPVPDGGYRLEITATDAPSVPYNLAQSSTWRTARFMVDHTPPEIEDLHAQDEGASIRIRFKASDRISVLKDAQVSLDGENWLQVAPEDRVFDRLEEQFDLAIPKEHLRGNRIVVKTTDVNYNEQSATATLGAPPQKRAKANKNM